MTDPWGFLSNTTQYDNYSSHYYSGHKKRGGGGWSDYKIVVVFLRQQKTVVIYFRMISTEHNPFLSLFAYRGKELLSENMLNICL